MSGSRSGPRAVGRSVPHQSARAHVTGTSRFVDDLPRLPGELQVGFLPAPVARGRIRLLELRDARSAPGVVGAYAAADVPGERGIGALVADEPFLPEFEIAYPGQPLALIAADSRSAALAALERVRLEIDPEPPVLGIEAAIAAGAYLSPTRRIARGDFQAAWAQAPRRHSGSLRLDGQEHFYMEPQAAVAWPDGEGLRVWSSTQNPTEVQAAVARVLGLARNRITCECHHVGGAFGGKETQCVLPACMAALVARHTGRPARVAYRRADDLRSTGKRHAFRCDYRVGFDERGRILAFKLELWADGGAFTDLSPAVVERAVLHGENAYFIPNLEISGAALRTNRAPSTAMRGFGAPQAVAAVENAIEEVAQLLRRDALEVRSLNLYGRAEAGEATAVTPYGQVIRRNLLPEILPRLAQSACYRERRAAIEAQNARSQRQLRGIALTPVKFGISFTVPHLNQANALVHVFTDGSVQVSTGATEIGQGVSTKIQQLVADALGIEPGSVRVLPTSTERSHNTSPTAASVSADLNGAAVTEACASIRERLELVAAAELGARLDGAPGPIAFAEGRAFAVHQPEAQIGFAELCERAWRARIDLGARGYYATPGLHFSWSEGRGEPFHYFTTGAAVSEVEIDRLTGAVRVLRADLLLDVGRRINPGIDAGQIIGGFVQALGWCTSELLVYDAAGVLLSDSGATYKIPGVADAPERLEIGYIEGDNPLGIAGSKGLGEPPFLLGISAWAAVKHALSCVDPALIAELRLPATGERILRLLTQFDEARRKRFDPE